MALTFNSSIGVFSNWHTFDNSWLFEYTTLTKSGRDATQYPDEEVETDRSKYPAGTIFFDSDISNFVMSSSVKNVYIDKVPIKLKSSNIQYTSITNELDEEGKPTGRVKHRCIFIFDSKTPIDPGNLSITLDEPVSASTADNILYEVSRKKNKITSENCISDITLAKNADLYTLTFNISVDNESSINDKKLTDHQIYVTVWNIAGNKLTINTNGTWKTILTENDIGDAVPLIITFTDPVPENRIVYPPNEGSIRVIVQNPNAELFDIVPTVRLEDDSIGIIDGDPTANYDPSTGTLSFYVRPITDTGYVVVSAWLSVNNTEIDGALKAKTYAIGMDGEWIGATEGRLIRFKQNVPKYLKNDNYASFVQATEDFFNTVYTSLTNGKHISILEKFARINNFNDIKAMEAPLIDLYRKQYGIQVQPNNDDLNVFLRNKRLPDPKLANKAQNDEYIYDDETNEDTDTKVLKNFMFQDITGLELNSFIKDIYKNIPYYNQMAGTYRGIKFILDQMGLCVKLVEIWSTREIVDNFDHNEVFAREDELNANRFNLDSGLVSDIGRYYLTSRFDVDVMETGLTFKEFNDLSYNIVKLILKVKPIHRVLRKLAYIHVTNTNLHFQYFLLDKLGRNQEIPRYKYTWNLFDPYAVRKVKNDMGNNHIWSIGEDEDAEIFADALFFPFNTVDAQYKHDWERYNAYGEDRNYKYAQEFLNPRAYNDMPTTDGKKPYFNIYNSHVDDNADTIMANGYGTASKNSYNNLFNIAEKLKRSRCKKIKIKFCYLNIHVDGSDDDTPLSLCVNRLQNSTLISDDQGTINTINPVDLTFSIEETIKGLKKMVSYSLVDYLLGKYDADTVAKFKYNSKVTDVSSLWTTYEFELGTIADVVSDTNGFWLKLKSNAQSILSELGVNPSYNENTHYNSDDNWRPLCLLARIEDFRIALGTDYLTYEEPEKSYAPVIHYDERKYDTIENLQNYQPPVFELKWMNTGWGTCYYVLKKGHSADRLDPANWERVYTARHGETHHSSLLTTLPSQIIHINSEVELDAEGYPIVVFAHYGTVDEYYTKRYKNGLIHYGRDEAQNEDITFAFSDEDDQDNPEIFKVMDKAKDDKYAYIIYRVSDLAQHADFSIDNGDAEFALIVDKN